MEALNEKHDERLVYVPCTFLQKFITIDSCRAVIPTGTRYLTAPQDLNLDVGLGANEESEPDGIAYDWVAKYVKASQLLFYKSLILFIISAI